jgi:hypothetical protein
MKDYHSKRGSCIYVCKGWAKIHRALAMQISRPNVLKNEGPRDG